VVRIGVQGGSRAELKVRKGPVTGSPKINASAGWRQHTEEVVDYLVVPLLSKMPIIIKTSYATRLHQSEVDAAFYPNLPIDTLRRIDHSIAASFHLPSLPRVGTLNVCTKQLTCTPVIRLALLRLFLYDIVRRQEHRSPPPMLRLQAGRVTALSGYPMTSGIAQRVMRY
jgi:hypothetical protein